MSKSIKAAREGWYTLDTERPRLLGTQCDQCDTYYFPIHETYCRNPNCDSEAFTVLELSHRGKIWSYTNNVYQPPEPYISTEPFETYGIAAVTLETEKLVILGQLSNGVKIEQLSVGDEMEVVLEALYEDEQHNYLVWKWKPITKNDSSIERDTNGKGGRNV